MDNTPLSGSGSLMTLAEVAAYLKVAEKTVSRRMQRVRFPPSRWNQWRFSQHAQQSGS